MDDHQTISQITNLAIQILEPLALALATWLGMRIVKFVNTKFKIQIASGQEAMIQGWIGSGIRFAEEKAHQAAGKADAKITGHEKLEHATSFVIGMAEKNGWTDWTRDHLKAMIDAKINVLKERPGSPAGE